jgi:hypothetical protein
MKSPFFASNDIILDKILKSPTDVFVNLSFSFDEMLEKLDLRMAEDKKSFIFVSMVCRRYEYLATFYDDYGDGDVQSSFCLV